MGWYHVMRTTNCCVILETTILQYDDLRPIQKDIVVCMYVKGSYLFLSEAGFTVGSVEFLSVSKQKDKAHLKHMFVSHLPPLTSSPGPESAWQISWSTQISSKQRKGKKLFLSNVSLCNLVFAPGLVIY